MSRERGELIAELKGDLRPVARAGRVAARALGWLAGAAIFTVACLALGGPFRAGSLGQLAHAPQFLMESAVGAAAIVALAVGGLRLALPSMTAVSLRVAVPLALAGAWLALGAFGLVAPALEPSMAGKRPACVWEVALVGMPTLVAALYLARGLWPLRGGLSGLLLGLAAGGLPALAMQFACMYVPAHNLTHHLLPGLALGALGALGGRVFPRPR